MFILKSKGRFVVAAPRARRAEGMLMTTARAEAKTFETKADATDWLAAIRERQINQGFKRHELATATAVAI